jgi:hypothetical protein
MIMIMILLIEVWAQFVSLEIMECKILQVVNNAGVILVHLRLLFQACIIHATPTWNVFNCANKIYHMINKCQHYWMLNFTT